MEKRESRGGRFTVVGVPPGRSVWELVEAFSASPLVEYAEPNFYAYATLTPNDPLYNLQWHFDNATYGGIHMEQAWDIETGDAGTVVAVVDTGVAYEGLAGARGRAQVPLGGPGVLASGYLQCVWGFRLLVVVRNECGFVKLDCALWRKHPRPAGLRERLEAVFAACF